MKTLLVAVQKVDWQIVSNAARGEFNIVMATSLAEARNALRCKINAIVCGVHFNEGNMLSFLDEVRLNPGTADIPFVCVKGSAGRLHPESYVATMMVCRQREVEYIDLTQLIDQYGREHAYGEMRTRLHEILSGPSSERTASLPTPGADKGTGAPASVVNPATSSCP
ncbi:MAG: hypothetical protein JWR21_3292 [Herminiimonas sp.]|nr:hypothetical protein [Herminiimonas sp.]